MTDINGGVPIYRSSLERIKNAVIWCILGASILINREQIQTGRKKRQQQIAFDALIVRVTHKMDTASADSLIYLGRSVGTKKIFFYIVVLLFNLIAELTLIMMLLLVGASVMCLEAKCTRVGYRRANIFFNFSLNVVIVPRDRPFVALV